MNTLVFVVLALLMAALVACVSIGESSEDMLDAEPTSEPEEQVRAVANIPLATLWYLVYGFDQVTGACKGGLDSTGWERPQETVYYPDAGLYCSGDDDYIAYAIAKMKEAGIDTIFLSWNGDGDVDFDTIEDAPDFAATDAAVLKILQYLNLNEPTMKVALLVEAFMLSAHPPILPSAVTVPRKQGILDDVWERFYNVYPNQIFNLDGKPLIFTWRPPEGRFLLSETADPRFTFREWGVLSEGAEWEMTAIDGLDGMKIGTDGTIWIFPRFDEYYMWINGHPGLASKAFEDLVRQDVRLEEGLYDAAWKKVYDNVDDITMVVVYGWNPWAESPSLEPSSVGPYPQGHTLIEKSLWYFTRLLQGDSYRKFPAK